MRVKCAHSPKSTSAADETVEIHNPRNLVPLDPFSSTARYVPLSLPIAQPRGSIAAEADTQSW